MKKKLDKKNQTVGQESLFSMPRLFNLLPAYFLGATLFLVAFFPDEKLNRLKLICFGLGLIFAGLFWAYKQTRQKEWVWYATKIDIPILLYLVLAFLYYFSSQNPAIALSEFQRMLFSVGTFFVTVQICSGPQSTEIRRNLILAWIGGLFLISIYGILQKFGGWYIFQVPQLDRVFATFGNPIFFAAYLIISIPVLIGFTLETEGKWKKNLLGFILFLSFLALFYTRTRAAFLALFLSLLLFYILIERRWDWKWSREIFRRKIQILIGITLFFVLNLGLYFMSSSYANQMRKVGSAIQASRITATSQTHTVIWKDVLKMWLARPWIGTGYGTFHVEFPQYASNELKAIFPQAERIVNDAHNEYLQILAETGLFGFLIFMSVLFTFFYHASKKELSKDPESPSFIPLGVLIGVTALLIQNIFSVDMRFIISSIFIFLGMGFYCSTTSKAISLTWGGEKYSKWFKLGWCLFFILLSGILSISYNPKSVYLAGVWRYNFEKDSSPKWEKTTGAGMGLIPSLLRPYLSQKKLANTPNFFDEKLLNSAKTIHDLEALTQQFPEQWKYWEKLGYALAKEIQTKTPDGQKVNNGQIAERAVVAYLKAHELEPRAEGPPNNLGNIFYTVNQRDQAIVWWKKAIATNPDKIDARLNLGIAYYMKGMIKESATQFEEVLKRDPQNEKAIVMLKRMVE